MARFLLLLCVCALPECFAIRLQKEKVKKIRAKRTRDRMAALESMGESEFSGSNSSSQRSPFPGRLSDGPGEPLQEGVTLNNASEWGANDDPFDDMFCPGSGASTHAAAKAVYETDEPCENVRHEMTSRSGQIRNWHDPGNMYGNAVPTYHPISSRNDSQKVEIGRTTPRFKFHDLIHFNLIPNGANSGARGCLIKGCSESQGFSVGDFHTNYCNIFNLICGSQFGCKPAYYDFAVREVSAFSTAGMRDYQECFKYMDSAPAEDPENLDEYVGWSQQLWQNLKSKPWEWVAGLLSRMPDIPYLTS